MTQRRRTTLPGGVLNDIGIDVVEGLLLAGYTPRRVHRWLRSRDQVVPENVLHAVSTGRRGRRPSKRDVMRVRLELDAAERRAKKACDRAMLLESAAEKVRQKLAKLEGER